MAELVRGRPECQFDCGQTGPEYNNETALLGHAGYAGQAS